MGGFPHGRGVPYHNNRKCNKTLTVNSREAEEFSPMVKLLKLAAARAALALPTGRTYGECARFCSSRKEKGGIEGPPWVYFSVGF
ncbi:MAG: hypothetical protein SV375_08030 [Thermodesulfobacteriota bacterium]|nr:hypothetical protein [Thermodesulfobacteriota bacterium]